MKSKIVIKIKKLISVLICTTLISSTLPPNLLNYVVFAIDPGTSTSTPGPSVPDVFGPQVENGFVSDFYSLKNAIDNANDGDVITLTSNITIPDAADAPGTNYYCVLNCSKNITIKSEAGQRYTINHESSNGFLAMIDGCTVNFENIIIDFGNSNNKVIFHSLIKLYNASTLNIKSNTTLQYAETKQIYQGENISPIYCENKSNINLDSTSTIKNLITSLEGTIYLNNSTLTLNGDISNCRSLSGGAIYAKNNSEVTLNGSISNCNAGNGGAIYSYDSTTTLNGSISNCNASNGGATYSSNSTITLNGSISNCVAGTGGAIFLARSSILQMRTGPISSSSSISGCYSNQTNGSGNAIYIARDNNVYLPTPDTGLFSITVPDNALGSDSAQERYGYPGIYDENYGKITRLYHVQLDFNGGVDSSGNTSTASILVMDGESLGDMLPTNLTKTISNVNYNLHKWLDGSKNEVTSNAPIKNNTTLHARYVTPQISAPSLFKKESDSGYNAEDWSNENITLYYSISSPESPINSQNYKISLNGSDFNDASIYSSSDTLQIDNSDASSLEFTIIKGGEYQIQIQAFDSEGLSTTSDPISVKIDKIKPEPVTIDNSEYSNVDTVEMYGRGEQGCAVTAKDENNNVVGTSIVDANGEWAITTYPMPDGQHYVQVVQTDIAGNQSDGIVQMIIVDTTPPIGSISISYDSFYQFLNTISFGLLFTETTNVRISAYDDPPPSYIIIIDEDQPHQITTQIPSGIKTIQYLKTDKVYSNITDIPETADWKTDTMSDNFISFNVAIPQNQLNDKFFIYAKITDNAENTTYLRSDGVILYTDSAVTTDEISYTKLDPQDKDLSVTLNGNKIASITNGNHTLAKNTDYRIENNKIILRHEYLNSLDVGDYKLKIHFTPAGEANLDPNLTLPSSTVALYVEKASQQHPPEDAKFNNLHSSYTYGDNPGTISLNGGSGTGSITYTSTNPDVATINSTTREITILKAGTFKIIATKEGDNYYADLVVTSDEIAVNKRNATITGVTAHSKIYDGNKNAEFDINSAQINNLVNNDQITINSGTASFIDKNASNGKSVIFSGFSLSGNKADSYDLYVQPTDATANITPKALSVKNVAIKDKILDKTTKAEFDGNPILEGVIDGDKVTLNNGTPVFTNANAGTNILVNFSTPFSLKGPDSSNYSITQPSNISGNIIAYEEDDSTDADVDDDATSNITNSEDNASLESPESEDNIISGSFEAEDPATGIIVSAPEGIVPPWCTLFVEEIYPNTNQYNNTYNKLDENKKTASEHNKLYEIHLEDQDGNVIQPNTSKGLMTVKIPIPENYDLADLEIYRINEGSDDDFDESIVTVNNKNYCEYKTDHFSPYAMVDKNTIYDIIQSLLPYLIISLAILFIVLFISMILKKKKDK